MIPAWVAPGHQVAALLEPFGRDYAEVRHMWRETSDLEDGFFTNLVSMCGRLECAPEDLLRCWYSESDVKAYAHNKNGNASGIFQLMPSTAKVLRWDPKDADAGLVKYRMLTATQQLPWAESYYRPHRGSLYSATACYLCNFMPGLVVYAKQPSYMLASHDLRPEVYWANRGFDVTNKGRIVVQDLTDRMIRACVGPRWDEIMVRLKAAQAGPSAA